MHEASVVTRTTVRVSTAWFAASDSSIIERWRSNMVRRLTIALSVIALLGAACEKKPSEDKAPSAKESLVAITAENSLVESFANATITWLVSPDGKVQADVKDKDG